VSGAPDVVLVKSGFNQVAIHIHEITFAEAARNYVLVHLESGAVIKSRVPIERLAQHLGTARFLRIHRGRLVNVERIRAVMPLTGGRLRLALLDGATILVARDRRRAVLAELTALAARGA
jgi:two-component system LytT family response regulator